MLFEILVHLASLDIAWFLRFALFNPFLVFALFLFAEDFARSKDIKSVLVFFAFMVFDFGVHFDFVNAVGWTFTEGNFLLFAYISLLAFSLLFENMKCLSKYIIVGILLQNFATIVLYNLFLR